MIFDYEPGWASIQKHIEEMNTSQIDSDITRKLLNQCKVAASKSTKTQLIPALEGLRILRAAHEKMEKILKAEIENDSKYKWLWFLRRVPNHIFDETGNLISTVIQRRKLAEALICKFCNDKIDGNINKHTKCIEFKVDEKTMQRVLSFCFGVKRLDHLQVLMRWGGKVDSFKFSGKYCLPIYIASPETRKAVELYDARLESETFNFTRLGTALKIAKTIDSSEICHLKLAFKPYRRHTNIDRVEVRNYIVESVSIDDLIRFLDHKRIESIEIWTPLVASIIIMLSVCMDEVRGGTVSPSLFLCGYITIDFDRLEDAISRIIPILGKKFVNNISIPAMSAKKIYYILSKSVTKTLPLIPSLLVTESEYGMVFNVFAGVQRLVYELEYPSGDGDVANYRGDDFELSVQHLIDNSPWKPCKEIRGLQRRKIKRLNGTVLTDIDAIGEKAQDLLIVSCKSKLFTSRYDDGNRSCVSSGIDVIEKAITKMNEVVDYIVNNKSGKNYQFSNYKNIIGVVCTPNVLYVKIGECTRNVASGLPYYVSYSELERWLETGDYSTAKYTQGVHTIVGNYKRITV